MNDTDNSPCCGSVGTKPIPAIRRGLEELQIAVSRLFDVVDTMEERLSMVLGPQSDPPPAPPTEAAATSELANNMLDQADRIQQKCSHVALLTERVEL